MSSPFVAFPIYYRPHDSWIEQPLAEHNKTAQFLRAVLNSVANRKSNLHSAMARSVQATSELPYEDVSQAIVDQLLSIKLNRILRVSFIDLKGKGWGKMEGYSGSDNGITSGNILLSRGYLDFLEPSQENDRMILPLIRPDQADLCPLDALEAEFQTRAAMAHLLGTFLHEMRHFLQLLVCPCNTPPQINSVRRLAEGHSGSHLQELLFGGELGAAFDINLVGVWSECRAILVYKDSAWYKISPLALADLVTYIDDISAANISEGLSDFDPKALGMVMTLAKGQETGLMDGGRYGRSESRDDAQVELVISSDKCAN